MEITMSNKNSKLLFLGIFFIASIACGSSQSSTPNPTLPPIPTSSKNTNPSADSNATFDLSTANQVRPEDILEEVTYYGQGAGNCPDIKYLIPTAIGLPTDTILMMESSLFACGWEENEVLTGKVIYPDGRIFTYTIKTYQDFTGVSGSISFTPSINDPIGSYKLVLIGKNGSVEATVRYSKPIGPHIFYTSDNKIYLYGFSSSEQIALYCFDSTGQIKDGDYVGVFLGWNKYYVDTNGTLTLNAPTGKCNFAAIGDISGEVHSLRNLVSGGTYDWAPETIKSQSGSNRKATEQSVPCPGAPTQRLGIGEMAYVCTSADTVKLREGPGKNYSVIKSLVPGADLKVIGGPECNDNWSWWQVKTESGYIGWMSEGGDSTDKYYLCPRN